MEKLELNVNSITEKEATVIIREGEAPRADNFAKKALTGDINAPADFFQSKQKIKPFDFENCFVVFDYENSKITFYWNTFSELKQSTIQGQLLKKE